MSLHFPGQTASAYPGQAASTAVTHLTDTVFLTLHSVWHFVIPVTFLKGHCVSLISSISPCFGNVLQKQAILEYLFLLKSIFTCIYLSVCQQTACVGVSSLLLPHRSWESISGHQAWRQEPVPAEPPLSPFLSPLLFTAFSSVGSVFTSPSSLCFYNANKFSSFFLLLLTSHLELTWVLNKCSFHIYFLCLTQVLAYGDKLIQFVILLPQLPKCISLSCLWWLIMLYFSYSLWW